MTQEKIISIILEIIKEIAPEEDLSHLDPEIPLREQIGLDSVDFLNIVMELRMRYDIDVPEEDYLELTTLNRCAAYLEPMFEKVTA